MLFRSGGVPGGLGEVLAVAPGFLPCAHDPPGGVDKYGHGAIVNSSRGIRCAWTKTGRDGRDFAEAARNAAIAMREDIRQFVTIV